ncbi:MAG: hypothetical protein ACK5MJ_08620 [Alphaproteobacteria bacterium]
MKNLWSKIITSVVATSIGFSAAAAPQSLGRENAWEAVRDADRNICYMVSFPLRSEGNYTKRDGAYLTITIRPSDNIVGEIAFYAGYPYGNKAVSLTVGGKTHQLSPEGEWAWTKDKNADAALLNDLMAGSRLVIKGYSKRGTLTTDTFSLSGVTASWRKIKSACGQ